ncbi:hypothetical protein HLH33_17720 [Gluconacetobacter diazotrophicus]|uniref:Uncharacterized protein n=1 Tax=Gluconacetobacter diazotrophicus TaxID=33996 RepID=A0A7W4NI15_GLUDI|nr:hypothetical protein [Gluconacetobacter diazotrophicus]MBB2158111.1 hypothetical protein [Gluconacetobacter diazotrophicus]
MTVGLQCPSLLRPPLTSLGLKATKWDGPEDKARGGNAILSFIARGMPRSAFNAKLYRRLSRMFGFIACNNLHGFWQTHLATTASRTAFLGQIEQHPCWGQSDWTWSDVERQIANRLRDSHLVGAYRAEEKKEMLRAERDQLARLLAKHGRPADVMPPALQAAPQVQGPSQLGLL